MFLAQNPAPAHVRWIIAGISIAMILFSRWFQNKFKLDRDSQMQMQMKNQELQERMKIAKAEGNQEELLRVNVELMDTMKDMSKKQFIPMCIRSAIWMGLWGILQLIFGQYDEFLSFNFIFGRKLISLYLLASLSFTAVSLLYNFIKKKLKPVDPEKDDKPVYDHIGGLKDNLQVMQETEANNNADMNNYNSAGIVQSSSANNNYSENSYDSGNNNSNKSWKNRLDD